MASQIQQPSDLWDLEHYLTERRKQIDHQYDYRHSQLMLVFGKLLRESQLGEEDARPAGRQAEVDRFLCEILGGEMDAA